VRVLHKSLVRDFDEKFTGPRFDTVVQEQLKKIRLSDKFDVRRTTFDFAVRLLTSLTSSSVAMAIDDQTFQLFQQNLYKISKAIHDDTIHKSAKAILTQLTGLSETLDINANVLDYIQTWIQQRKNDSNNETAVSSTSGHDDFLDSILHTLDETSPRLDDEDLAACVLDLIMHGSEMLKGALSWLLLYVVKYPQEADACRRETRYSPPSLVRL
jgi:cytochrome P450